MSNRFGLHLIDEDEIFVDMIADVCPHDEDRRLIVGHGQTDQRCTTLDLALDFERRGGGGVSRVWGNEVRGLTRLFDGMGRRSLMFDLGKATM